MEEKKEGEKERGWHCEGVPLRVSAVAHDKDSREATRRVSDIRARVRVSVLTGFP